MKKLFFVSTLCAVFTAMVSFSATAQNPNAAVTTQSQTILSYDGKSVPNSCNGDNLNTSGNSKIIANITQKGDFYHIALVKVFQGLSAVGSDGTVYRCTGVEIAQSQFPDQPVRSQNGIVTYVNIVNNNYIATGGSKQPNLLFKIRYMVTMDTNTGEVNIKRDIEEVTCK